MIPTINDIIADFIAFYEGTETEDIAIKWNFWTDNELFLHEITNSELFQKKNILFIEEYNKKLLKKFLKKHENKSFDAIICYPECYSDNEWKKMLAEYNISGRKIFGNNTKNSQNIETFTIESISFRQFSEKNNGEFSVQSILTQSTSLDNYEADFQSYLKSGSFIKNIEDDSDIISDFHKKWTIIAQELFEKEYNDFINAIRLFGMNVGELYKEDSFAKNLGISRRKLAKFSEILEKHNIITFLSPFVTNSDTETSRHNKIYFSDLSYLRWALENMYQIGNNQKWMIENFVFLELERKLNESHELFFWRKKSGTEINFILKNKETNKLTPIEIGINSSIFMSKAMKSFYESYSDTIENGMHLQESSAKIEKFDGKPFLILPYYAI